MAGNALAAPNGNLLGNLQQEICRCSRTGIILMKLYFQRDPQEAFGVIFIFKVLAYRTGRHKKLIPHTEGVTKKGEGVVEAPPQKAKVSFGK